MKTLTRRILRYSSVGALFLCMLVFPTTKTQALADEASQAANTQAKSASYNFEAKQGYSLTKVVRRALQLYQADNKVTLTPAAAVYCETLVTHSLGDTYLEVGQQVDVPSSALSSCVEASKTLSAQQLKVWENYASNVSFDVTYIAAKQTAGKTEATNSQATDSKSADEQSDQNTPAAEETKKNEATKSAGGYWWFIGAAALAAIYFVLGGPAPSKRTRK